MRQVLARQHPVTNAGPHYPLPYPGGTGLGKPLKSIVHPLLVRYPDPARGGRAEKRSPRRGGGGRLVPAFFFALVDGGVQPLPG